MEEAHAGQKRRWLMSQGAQNRQVVKGANKIMVYTDKKIVFFSEVELPDSARAEGLRI